MEAFWSTLKGHNVLEAEHLKFRRLVDEDGLTGAQALKKMQLQHPPPTKEEAYQSVLDVWQNNNMRTFSDYLRWYNDLDVGPFVEGAERMQEFYREKEIDVFKVAISCPGLARALLFRTARQQHASFALFGNDDRDLHRKIKNNIIGGPSIIFTRHHKVGETKLRGEEGKTCGNVVGFDANALYLG